MFNKYVYKKPSVRAAVAALDAVGYVFARKAKPKQYAPPRRICVLALHQIGDIVMCLPSIDALTHLFPEAKLTLVANQVPAQLLEANPWNADVRTFNPRWQKVVRQFRRQSVGTPTEASGFSKVKESPSDFMSLIQEVNPDLVLVFHPDLRVNTFLNVTKIPYTFAFTNAGGGFGVTHPVDMPTTGHQVERNFALVQAIAAAFDKPIPKLTAPKLAITKEAHESVAKLLKEAKVSPEKLVVLHPFASAPTKNWLPERWNEVIAWLHEQGLQSAIIGGKQDSLETTKPVLDLCGKLSLSETAALIEQAHAFIGIDSGPAHSAAAVGCPVVSIFSSVNDPKRWHPYGDNVTVLHKPVTDRHKYPYERRDLPQGTPGNPYSDKITVEDVTSVLQRLLQEAS